MTLPVGRHLADIAFQRTPALRQEGTFAVVPKNIPESLTLRMLYPAFSQERQEDIGPLGKKPPEIAPSFIRNGIAPGKEIVGHMACFASHAVERHDQRFDAVAVIMEYHPAAAS